MIIGKFQGIAFESNNTSYLGYFQGLSFESNWNLRFRIFDNSTLLPTSALMTITNITNGSDLFTNGLTNYTANTHDFYLENDSTIQIDIAITGYEPFTQQYVLDSENENIIDVFLIPEATQNLICDSFIGTATGVQTNAIIKGEDNYLFCDFTIPSFVSANDWSIVFSGFPLNGDKKSSQNYTATYFGLVGTNKHRWRAKLNGTEDNYGFTARIRKKI